MPTVRIKVTIDMLAKKWKPIIGPTLTEGQAAYFTVPVFSLPDGGGTAPSPRTGPLVKLKEAERGQSVRVRGPAKLQFFFPDPAMPDGKTPNPDYAGWRPIGISFSRVPPPGMEKPPLNTADDTDDLSRDTVKFGFLPKEAGNNFKTPYVEIEDKWNQHDSPDSLRQDRWKYMIVIQDCYGNVGVIDPEIENSSLD